MVLLTISNLYPRPDQPSRGLYNAQLFGAMRGLLVTRGGQLENVCLVPEWQVSKWRRIRSWTQGHDHFVPVPYVPLIGRSINADVYRLGLAPLGALMHAADVVYTSWLYPDGVAIAALARKANKPHWLMALGSDTFHLNVPTRARQILDACHHAAGIVCVWKGLADRLIKAGVKGAKIHVVPNGVDSSRFRFRELRDVSLTPIVSDVISRAGARPIVLFVGNLVEVKGPDLFIQAVIQCFDEGVKPLFVVVGDGPMRRHLEQAVCRSGHGTDVMFLGNQRHDDVAHLMNAAACLCLSSRSEGMPNVVIESLASGLPVVATDVGAVRDMLTGVPGTVVVASERPVELAGALRQALRTSVDRSAMAKVASSLYSWDSQAEHILDLIGMAS